MKIVLLDDVENVGHAGAVVEVKEGYFRNYLSPRRLAVPSTVGGLRFLEAKKKQAAVKFEKLKEEALNFAKQIETTPCVVQAHAGEEGKLFGAVTARQIQDALEKQGIVVERRRIEMVPIHQVGEYEAKIRLHSEVEATLKISVTA